MPEGEPVMSDTPRTDEQDWTSNDLAVVDASFARKLERELAQANAWLDNFIERMAAVFEREGIDWEGCDGYDDPAEVLAKYFARRIIRAEADKSALLKACQALISQKTFGQEGHISFVEAVKMAQKAIGEAQ
jgi:hypothetical protein